MIDKVIRVIGISLLLGAGVTLANFSDTSNLLHAFQVGFAVTLICGAIVWAIASITKWADGK